MNFIAKARLGWECVQSGCAEKGRARVCAAGASSCSVKERMACVQRPFMAE